MTRGPDADMKISEIKIEEKNLQTESKNVALDTTSQITLSSNTPQAEQDTVHMTQQTTNHTLEQDKP